MYEFKSLVRFAKSTETHYGDLIETVDNKYRVRRLIGSPFTQLDSTDDIVLVDSLLTPIERTPILQCVGLNYRSHIAESGFSIPKEPPIFSKPADALAGPFDEISVHPAAQEMLDWEVELVFVVGRDAKNVSEADALDYVLGYTVGNDLSARGVQIPEVSGGQYGYAKSFDGFAPIGHTLVSASQVPDPQRLRLTTKINGAVKQDNNTSDMIWSVRKVIQHLSRGTTLRKGTVVMTGTPSGVGFFQKQFLKDGDVVEVEVEGVGQACNTIRFEE